MGAFTIQASYIEVASWTIPDQKIGNLGESAGHSCNEILQEDRVGGGGREWNGS